MEMSEGNPGAVSVLTQFINDDIKDLMLLLSLDDMNIRGTQVWIGYKDFCKEDIEKFKACIHTRDADMITKINMEGLRGNHKHKAVTSGASYDKRELLEV